VAGEPASIASWDVSVLTLGPGDAADLLLALSAEPQPGAVAADSLRFLGEVAKLAVELVARGRMVPGLVGSRAVWRPLPDAGADEDRLVLLARAMPAECRAEAAAAPRVLVDAMVGALADAVARSALAAVRFLPRRRGRRPAHIPVEETWLDALTGDDPEVPGDPGELESLAKELDAWAQSGLGSSGASGPLRTCFRVSPPAEDAEDSGEEAWRLDLLLQATGDRSLVVPAADVWKARGRTAVVLRRTLEDPQERLLADLGRALRLWPGLEPVLRSPRPDGLDLDAAGAHAFLREAAPLLEQAGFGVLVPPWWRMPGARLGLKLHVAPKDPAAGGPSVVGMEGICAYRWEVAVGGEPISAAEFRRLAALKVPLVRVRGQWVELRPDEVKSALALLDRRRAQGEMPAAEVLRTGLGLLPAEVGLPVVGVEARGWLGDLFASDGDRRLAPVATPRAFRGELRPYQERGLAWLAFLERLGLGACLADDMGLGKTVQLLALLLAERDKRRRRPGPTLLVCPMSVAGNWQREAERFAPSLAVAVHHGAERLSGRAFATAARKTDLLITTYSLVARDREMLAKVAWRRVVLDEAQNVKNSGAKQTQAVRSLTAERRVALTGTPVENRLSELWSIMEFLNPGLLGSGTEFRTRFAVPIERFRDEDAAARLKRLTGPFVLRRLKTDRSIIADLPEKVEMKVFCNLTREQATLYQAVVDEMMEKIEASEGMERKGLVLATMMKLKQVCNHPAQMLHDRSKLAGRSGKLARLEETLEEVLADGDRALVFTQFAEMGQMLRERLVERFARDVLYLHGGTPKKVRDDMVARFQSEAGPPVFILSVKAGGTGLNLTAASHVIHFDRWWNPAVEDQATDRAFRIGQRRNVQVRKFVCVGTLEERIDRMIESKRELAQAVVGTGESWLTELTTDEIRAVVALSPEAVSE
jgi:non-specific serine/threonine protein kinase